MCPLGEALAAKEAKQRRIRPKIQITKKMRDEGVGSNESKWKKSLWGSAVAGVLGVGIALAVPLSANAATVCCYRYWGVSNPGVYAGQFKQSPTVSLIDWSAAWVENTSGLMTVHSRVYWLGGSSLGSGGGGGWVYGNPGGEVSYAYGRCGFYWDVPDPGHIQNMYCDIKYSN